MPDLKKLTHPSVIISVLGIMLIVTLGSFALPWADDFCFLSKLEEPSPLEVAIKAYKEWDGRFLSYFLVSALLKLSIGPKLTIFFWIMGFLLTVKAVQNLALKKEYRNDIFLFFLLSAIFWIGMRRYISETVYWSTGGSYTFAAFIGIYWILGYQTLNLNSTLRKIAWSLFSVAAGISSFSLSPALITFIVYPKLIEFYKFRSIKKILHDKKFVLSLIFVLAGTILLIAAPGNFIRSTLAEDAFTGFIPWTFLVVNGKFTIFGWPLIVFAIALGVLLRDKIKEVNFHEKVRWLLVAISTASPFAVLNSFTSPRTSIFFHFFIFIFILLATRNIRISLKPTVQRLSLAAIVCGFYFMIISDHFKAYPYHKEYSSQLAVMEKNRETENDLIFEKQHLEPRSLRIKGLNRNPKNWSNLCTANYFKVRSILMNGQE